MIAASWKELEELSPVQDGVWDKKRLYEYLVQSCYVTFQEELNRFFYQYEADRQLAGLLLDFLLDEDYDGSDSQMGAAFYLGRMDRDVLRGERDRLLLAQADEVEWKRPFPGETPPWLGQKKA